MQMAGNLYPCRYPCPLPGLLFLAPPPSDSDFHSFGSPHPENNWEILLVNTLTLNKKTEAQTLHFEDRGRTPASVLLTSRPDCSPQNQDTAPHLQENSCPQFKHLFQTCHSTHCRLGELRLYELPWLVVLSHRPGHLAERLSMRFSFFSFSKNFSSINI